MISVAIIFGGLALFFAGIAISVSLTADKAASLQTENDDLLASMRQFACPVWYCQVLDPANRPDWDECYKSLGHRFYECPYFESKGTCWKRWDKEKAEGNQ